LEINISEGDDEMGSEIFGVLSSQQSPYAQLAQLHKIQKSSG
ncbi:26129_t:CDS:1, partial [Gigaspora rosea]